MLNREKEAEKSELTHKIENLTQSRTRKHSVRNLRSESNKQVSLEKEENIREPRSSLDSTKNPKRKQEQVRET
jgi:hypothetical protein